MIMDRPDISKLNKNRSIYLKLGFIIALTSVIYAFNWTSFPKPENVVEFELPDVEDIPVIRTATPKQKTLPPPPVISITEKIIPDEPDFTEDPIPEKVPLEVTVETKEMVETPPMPVVEDVIKKPIPVPVPPEPEPEDEIVVSAEEMPRFPGCEEVGRTKKEKLDCSINKLLNYLGNQIKYPSIARENGVTGVVVLSFVVSKKGKIKDITVVKDIGAGCGQESIRVVKKMPDWIPGKQRGRPVNVKYHLPVRFNLE